MHERKALMADLSDAFVALPGGVGTLEELFEVYTWNQLGLHAKPLGLFNVRGYYDGLARFLDHAVDGALRARRSTARCCWSARTSTSCSTGSTRWEAPRQPKWIDRAQS